MLPSSYLRSLAVLATIIVLCAANATGEENTSLSDPPEVLNTLPIELPKAYDFKIPPKPSGQILDTAHFLTQTMLENLEEALSREARDNDVHVFLLTVPSVQKNALDPFTQRVAAAWTKDLFGATIVFDDGSGHLAIQQSDQVTKRFYEFELSALLKDPMSSSKRPKLSRDALQHATLNLMNALHTLKMRANREDRRALWTRVVLGTLGLVAVGLGGFEYYRRSKITDSPPIKTDPVLK